MMKRLALFLLLVAACASEPNPGEAHAYGDWLLVGTDTWYAEVSLPDGRIVPCVVWSGYQKGGMSCDWNPR